jgi:DNA-binding transcriptional MerR regulator
LGFSLREIAELLALQTDLAADCAAVRQHAQAKLDEIDHKIAQLQRMQTALQQLISVCPGQRTLRGCPIIDALNGNEVTDP